MSNLNFLLQQGFLTASTVEIPATEVINWHPTYSDPDSLLVTIYPRWLENFTISWSYPATWIVQYANIYSSGAEEGPFKKLNLEPVTENWFKDGSQHTGSKFNQDFYVIELVLDDGRRVKSMPTTWDIKRLKHPELLANEINRREWLLLRKFVGVDTLVFPRKNYGTRCPVCWDAKAEKIVRDHCPSCFGSSFKDGFWKPMRTLMQYDVTPNGALKTYFGKFEQNQITAWTIAHPQLNPDDIVIRLPDMRTYEIQMVSTTELRADKVRQIAKLTELSRSDAEYALVRRIIDGMYPDVLADDYKAPGG